MHYMLLNCDNKIKEFVDYISYIDLTGPLRNTEIPVPKSNTSENKSLYVSIGGWIYYWTCSGWQDRNCGALLLDEVDLNHVLSDGRINDAYRGLPLHPHGQQFIPRWTPLSIHGPAKIYFFSGPQTAGFLFRALVYPWVVAGLVGFDSGVTGMLTYMIRHYSKPDTLAPVRPFRYI